MGRNKKNPFTQKKILQIEVSNIIDKSAFTRHQDGVLLHKVVTLEREPAAKVYQSPENRKIVSKLSNNAKSLFIHIIYRLEHGQDEVMLNLKNYMDENKIKSINTVKSALNELQQNQIIYQPTQTAKKQTIFINPNFFFSGSRIKAYPENIKLYKPKKNKPTEEIEPQQIAANKPI